MSSEQLDELWHYEWQLASQMFGLPLRQCSAKPASGWGVTMDETEFHRLKAFIRTLWARAAEFFELTRDAVKGFGLKVNDFSEHLSISENSCVCLGWLAVCPSIGECDTAHRYMRSPIGTNLYLAGAISLANWAKTSEATVKARKSSSSVPFQKKLYYVNTVKRLAKGTEVLWNYGQLGIMEFPLGDASTWIQPCCSEVNTAFHPSSPITAASISSRPTTPRGPRKRDNVIQSYRHCTLCGCNIDENVQKKNIKAHLVSHHAVDICYGVYSEYGSIHGTAFLSNLHAFCKIIECLLHNGYHIMPACHFFRISQTNPLPSNTSDASKLEEYTKFKIEAKAAFVKYKIIYLQGVSVPACYEDLLPSLPETSYKDITWAKNSRPPHGLFSIKGKLTDDEIHTLERSIMSSIQDIIQTYEMGFNV